MANLINPDKIKLDSEIPIPVQIYKEIRRQIVAEELKPGTRLPSALEFCKQLNLSKATLGRAFELLKSDGYIQTLVGSGAFVRGGIQKKEETTILDFSVNQNITPVPLSHNARTLLQVEEQSQVSRSSKIISDKRTRQIALASWNRAYSKVMEDLELCDQDLIDAREKLLRCEVARRLSETRGVVCRSAQIIPVASRRVALDLIARLHAGAGDLVAMQTHDSGQLRSTLLNQSTQVFELPANLGGNFVDNLPAEVMEKAAFLYLTPSCGSLESTPLSLKDRNTVLNALKKHQKLLVEDDVLVEHSASGLATRCLQGMASKLGTPVIYVNNLGPIFTEICQVSFLVVPLDISGLYRKAVQQAGAGLSALDTLVLSHMFSAGEFEMLALRTRNEALHKQSLLIKLVEKLMPFATVNSAEILGPCVSVMIENSSDRETFMKICQDWNFEVQKLESNVHAENHFYREQFQLVCNAPASNIYLASGEQAVDSAKQSRANTESSIQRVEQNIETVQVPPPIQVSLLSA